MDADSGEQRNKNFDRVRVSPRRAHCATKESMMTPTREQIAPHMARFLVMLDAAFRRSCGGVQLAVADQPCYSTRGSCPINLSLLRGSEKRTLACFAAA
jgi:hypothetical protein